jgi:cytoskeletal protein CcmA (bactofilin family)
MFGKSKGDATKKDRGIKTAPEVHSSTIAHSAAPTTPDATSSISSGLSIVGKIVGHGAVRICGHVEGELQASTVIIAEGAQVVGDVVAEDLTIGGQVKGSIHANHVKLNSTAVVEGDILHRSLVIDEDARFEGMSRRLENVIDTPSRLQTNRAQPRAGSMEGNGKANANSKANGAPGGPNP